MIRVHIEQAIRNLEAEKEQVLRQAEQRVMQEKIVPFNREIDLARDKAIKALQDKFEADKQDILVKSEQHKKEHAEEVVATEAAPLLAQYEMTIAALKETLGDTEE